MSHPRRALAAKGRCSTSPLLALLAVTLLHCSSPKPDAEGGCYPDNDGITGGSYTINLTVDDDGFSKSVLNTQNNSTVVLTLTNMGTLPHGFEVDCVDVTEEYPHLPAGCSSMSCFPDASVIEPLMPGESATVTFVTPVADDLIYPFKSSEPDDATVPGLTAGQWSLM